MQYLKLVDILELIVSAADGNELLFRLEVLAQGAKSERRFCCQLYRLETFRLRTLCDTKGEGNEWVTADYRCWVVDDSLGINIPTHMSASKARKKALNTLGAQLGIKCKLPKWHFK